MKKMSLLRYLVFTMMLLFGSSFLNAQVNVECGTVVTPESKAYLEQLLPQIQQFEDEFNQLASQRSSTALNSVPVKVHVLRTDAGTGGLSVNEINVAMAIMNGYYANAFIEFFLCEGINYIDDTNLYDFETSEQSAMVDANNVDNVINIYFANTVTSTSSGNGLCGYAYFPGGQEVILMSNLCANNGSTLSHEMGHFFGLAHTHGDVNGTLTTELVDGSNCSTSGDRICDTPADPELGTDNVTADCLYIGSDVDANNQFFNPDVFNIMSYSRKACRNQFSNGQYARIFGVYQTTRSVMACPSFNVDIATDLTTDCNTLDVDFTDNSVGATSWQWDIDGDDIIDYTVQNPSHTYSSNGIFDVTLTISDGIDSITKVYQNLVSVNLNDVNTTQLTLDLTTDTYAHEISWSLMDINGTTLYSSPTYVSGMDSNQTFTENFTIATNQCYIFEISDSYGDGICCYEGNGSYTLTTFEGDIIATGGNYGAGESTVMSNAVLGVDDYFISNSISVFPNPVKTTLNIKLSDTNNLPDQYVVYNMLGQIIKSERIAQISDLAIDVSTFSDGMYLIELEKDNNTTTIQFVKN